MCLATALSASLFVLLQLNCGRAELLLNTGFVEEVAHLQ